MKRCGNTLPEIVFCENLKKAFYRAQKVKRFKKSTILYKINLEHNLMRLRENLLSGNIAVGNYHFFTIHDPKKRTICAAPFEERVLHHALINILEPIFEKLFIFDSYACRKNKGTHKALHRAYYYTKKNTYFLKLDIRKYFDSISHARLANKLSVKIKDKRVLNILGKIIASYETIPGRGVPIGNLTSQYFANYYLSSVDRFIKEKLKIAGYVRYMDDMVVWCRDKKVMKIYREQIVTFIRTELDLEVKPAYENTCAAGVPFLGFLIKRNGIYLQQKSKDRFKEKFRLYTRNYHAGLWSFEKTAAHCASITAWTKIAKARAYRNSVIKRYDPLGVTA